MVNKTDRATISRKRLLAAASAEFAARGFAGAKVDRIAAKARLNKAMIYYHFDNKAALYREVLLGVFRTIADAVAAGVGSGPADEQIRRFIDVIAGTVATHPHFAPMWLREMADGGVHIESAVVDEMRRVLTVLGRAINAGTREGQFGAVHPLVAQLGIIAPLLFYAASQPVRDRVARQSLPLAAASREELVQHIEAATLGALRGRAGRKTRSTRGTRS